MKMKNNKIQRKDENMCVWVEDADKLSVSSSELNVVYTNKAIESYLMKSGHSLGLTGVKGQGKTFLIKVKRKLINEDDSTICLPYERMVDTVDSSITINQSLNKYLKDYNVWVDLWKFSISVTIITSKEINIPLSSLRLKKCVIDFIEHIPNTKSEASMILKELLNLDIRELMNVLEDTNILFNALRNVRKGVCLFFDKIDQGFSRFAKNFNKSSSMPKKSRNASYWQFAQYSLAECAYDIYTNASSHIKIYYTMRQEATIDSEYLNKDKARNINAYITTLKYSKTDLRQMYNLYIEKEDKKNLIKSDLRYERPSEAFIGLEEIPHGYINMQHENVFDYIYRHTFKRPYDIMLICRALFMSEINETEDNIKSLRHIVNQKSNELLNMYLQELSIFIPSGTDYIEYLSQMLTGNVLNSKILRDICSTFDIQQDKKGSWKCNELCENCTNLYPFSVLYNIGLIGCQKQHAADKNPIISFENIGSSILDLKSQILPVADFYYIHPALSNYARDKRNFLGLKFNACNCMIIGDGCVANKESLPKLKQNVQKSAGMFKKEKVFISSTVEDLKRERKTARKAIKERGLFPIMSDYEIDTRNVHYVHSHDHCLDEIKKCKSMIFIIGKEYGGIYSGDKYLKERDEIIHLSGNRIEKPSISLMEFYLAKKRGMKCYAFMSKECETAFKNQTLNTDLIKEINFLNHYHNIDKKIQGNWILFYCNINDFSKRLSSCKFG